MHNLVLVALCGILVASRSPVSICIEETEVVQKALHTILSQSTFIS